MQSSICESIIGILLLLFILWSVSKFLFRTRGYTEREVYASELRDATKELERLRKEMFDHD